MYRPRHRNIARTKAVLKKGIMLGAKVATDEGDGIVVSLIHLHPMQYDVQLLDSNRVIRNATENGVRLLDNHPVDDPTVPDHFRKWMKAGRVDIGKKPNGKPDHSRRSVPPAEHASAVASRDNGEHRQ